MRQQNPPVLVTHPHQQHPIAQPYTLHIPPHHTASTSHTTTHPTHHTSHTRSHITSYTTPSPSHHFWQDNIPKMRQLKRYYTTNSWAGQGTLVSASWCLVTVVSGLVSPNVQTQKMLCLPLLHTRSTDSRPSTPPRRETWTLQRLEKVVSHDIQASFSSHHHFIQFHLMTVYEVRGNPTRY